MEGDLDAATYESDDARAGKLGKAVQEFATYIERNGGFIPNYGERYRNGERISTGFVESTVNYVVSKRMVKKQQMRWSQRGAHLGDFSKRISLITMLKPGGSGCPT